MRREGAQEVLVECFPPPRSPDHDRHAADDSRERQHRQTLRDVLSSGLYVLLEEVVEAGG